jgi:hypothetical protein
MERLDLGHRSSDRGDRGRVSLRDWLSAAQPGKRAAEIERPEIERRGRASVIAPDAPPDYSYEGA